MAGFRHTAAPHPNHQTVARATRLKLRPVLQIDNENMEDGMSFTGLQEHPIFVG
jgi:hypothetical protein